MPRVSVLVILTSLGLLAGAPPRPAQEYVKVDRIEDDWVNRNPVPTRPMTVAADGSLWAVNPYLSEVVQILDFADSDFTPAPAVGKRFRTMPGPVGIARYQPFEPGFNERLLVVCQHVNAVAVHDIVTGRMVAAIPVEAQPADILVDEENHAWVSCPAADAVVEIDLEDPGFAQEVYEIPAKSPCFLTLYQGEVLVAPRISGNGSLVARKPVTADNAATLEVNEHAGPKGILNTLDEVNVVVPGGGLPDVDLFWLDNSGAPTVRSLARSTGTLLFASAVHPATGALWQLNLEANNKNADSQTEPSIKGEFVQGRLTRITLPSPLQPPIDPAATPIDITLLNDTDPGTEEVVDYPETADTLGTPYSLAFTQGGSCFVAGLLTDNVVKLDASGQRIPGAVFDLDPGTMPRQVLVDPTDTVLAVWGTGLLVPGDDQVGDCKVHLFHIGPPNDSKQVSLGVDPTPRMIRLGRQIFFDASHSRHNDASCASCHDEGKTDMLAWNLSNIERQGSGSLDDDGFDNKGPMVTQTLVGISTAVPFHWRGEQQRGLLDFNDAFVDLLDDPTVPPGLDTETAGGQFDQFEAFVLSLTEDANQYQDRTRVLSNTIFPSAPDGTLMTSAMAIEGQTDFDEVGCTRCHPFPKGTTNEVVNNRFSGERLAKRLWLKTAPFQGLQFKATPRSVPVEFLPDPEYPETPAIQYYPAIGTGLSHAGVVPHLSPVLLTMVPEDPGTTEDDEKRDNVVSFLHQWDTGIAPAAHAFELLNSANYLTKPGEISAYLLDQASSGKRYCDVAVIGKLAPGNDSVPFSAWAYDRGQLKFRSELGVSRNLNYFKGHAQFGGWFAFVGLPPGTARRLAIDFDGDTLLNGLEPQGTKDGRFYTDTDGDLFLDGVETSASTPSDPANAASTPTDTVAPVVLTSPLAFQWVTQRVARLTFETSELSDATLTLTSNETGAVIEVQSSAKIQHNMVVDSLVHSQDYVATLRVSDLMLTPNYTDYVAFEVLATATPNQNVANTDSFVLSPVEGERVRWDPLLPTLMGSNWQFTAKGKVVERNDQGIPAGNMDVVARILIKTSTDDDLTVGRPALITDFLDPGDQSLSTNPMNNSFIVTGAGPTGSTEYTAISPPFVYAKTNSSGDFTITFTLLGSQVHTGDTISLSFEALGIHLINTDNDGIPGNETPVLNGNSVGDEFWSDDSVPEFVPGAWSFPDTIRENRKIQVTIPTPP